jgi:glucose/arabinose dehydrogenase/cytochrome c553
VATPFQGRPVSLAYQDTCASCHGLNREGGAIGPALLPNRLTQPDEVYFTIIKEGKPGTAMPGWAAAGLSDSEIQALVRYIKSPPPPGGTPAETNEATGPTEGGRRPATPADIVLPAGFAVTLLARLPEGKQPTSIAYGPDGALYIAVLAGEIYRLTDDGRLNLFAGPFSFPLGLAWRGDELYLSSLTEKGQRPPQPNSQCQPDDRRGQITVLRDTNGDGRADQSRVIIPDLPVGLNARHLVNGLAFGPDDKLYLTNGTCENRRQTTDDLRRGTIQRYNPDGTLPADNPEPRSPVIATGLRNPYDLAFHPADGSLLVTENGRDDLGDDLPPEELNQIVFGPGQPLRAYGWPECYGNGRGRDCQGTQPPLAELEAHASANGLAFYTADQFGPAYRHNLFIAYYGAGNPERRPFGRKVARVELTRSGDGYLSRVTDFAIGFDRPLDVLTARNGGLLVADFGPIGGTGAIFRIDRQPAANPFAAQPVLTPPPPAVTGTPPSAGGTAPAAGGEPVAAPRFFAETGQTVAPDFAAFWAKYGGLARFGYPISREMMEDGRLVQYFERARFERAYAERCPDRRPPLRPEECQEYRLRLGLIGRELIAQRSTEPAFQRQPPPTETERRYFAETGHSLSGEFRRYWEAQGGLRLFGLPLSEELTESAGPGGRPLIVQYFERARLERSAEPGAPGGIQLGQLGRQLANQRYP